MLKIGDFSKLSRISIRNLRHYDELGLLVPESVDQFTGYRYYTEHQLIISGRINALREMGFGLAAIGDILRQYHDTDALAEFLSQRLTQARAESDEAARRVLLLETAIQRLRKEPETMYYNVTKKTIPERLVASIRSIIPTYDKEGLLWAGLYGETAPLHIELADPSYPLAIFHDKGHTDVDPDVEIQLSVAKLYPNTERVVFKKVLAVEIASTFFKGDYHHIEGANLAVANWVNDNGYEFDGPMFCIYHVSPAQTQNPDELVTEVCYPIRKR